MGAIQYALARRTIPYAQRQLGGTIDFDTGRVTLTPRKHDSPAMLAALEHKASLYLRGGAQIPSEPALRSIIKEIDMIRLRPFTPTEQIAFSSQTPANRAALFKAAGMRGGLRSVRRRRRRAKSASRPQRARRVSRRARRARPARLVKGSPAARRHMSKLRRMRRRRR
jgi:hypothetical protein